MIPLPARLMALAALLLALVAGVYGYGRVQYSKGKAAVLAELRDKSDAAAEAARLITRDRSRITSEIDHAQVARSSALAASAAADRSELDRMRRIIAAASQPATGDAGATGCPDVGRFGRLGELLSESASLAVEGSQRVERLASDKAALQEFVARVCLK